MKRLYRCSLSWLNIPSWSFLLILLANLEVNAEAKVVNFNKSNPHLTSNIFSDWAIAKRRGRSLGRFLQDDLANQNDSYSIQTDLIGKFKIGKIDNQVLFGVEWIRFDSLDDSAFATVDAINILEPVYNAPRSTLFDDGASTFASSSDSIGLYLQDQLTLLPNLKLLLGGRYEFIDETSEFQDLDVDGKTSISEVFKDSYSNQAFQLPDYVRTDATIFYNRDRWNLALNFQNLFDQDYYTNQGSVIYPGNPFTVLGSVSVKF